MKNNTGRVDYGSQDGAEMESDPILKHGNKLLCGDKLFRGLVTGAYSPPDVLEQPLDFADDESTAGSCNPRAHSGLEEKQVHPRYAAQPVLDRLLIHRCILARPVTGQVWIIGAGRQEVCCRPSAGRPLPQGMRGCPLLLCRPDRQALKRRISGSEEASGSRSV